jgi:type IV secretory pathway TraG/TraD family ATPase VirD4
MCGNTTAPMISVSESSSVNVETKGTSMSGSARPLYDPNEVMNLPERVQLIFFQGQQPIYSVRIPYYEADALFKYNGDPVYDRNPYHS